MTLPSDQRQEVIAGGGSAPADPDLPVSLAAHRPRWRAEELGGLVSLYARRHAAMQAVRRVEEEDLRLQQARRTGSIGRGSPDHAVVTDRPRPRVPLTAVSLSGVRESLRRVLAAPKPAVLLHRPR